MVPVARHTTGEDTSFSDYMTSLTQAPKQVNEPSFNALDDLKFAIMPQTLPFIFTPWVTCTILDLLSVSYQLQPGDSAGPMLFFPNVCTRYNLSSTTDSWRTQWQSFAHVDGQIAHGVKNHGLVHHGGLTKMDWETIQSRVLEGDSLYDVWK